jgi:hypothetical protein
VWTDWVEIKIWDSKNVASVIFVGGGFREPAMLTRMTDADWEIVVDAFGGAVALRRTKAGMIRNSRGAAFFCISQHHPASVGGVWQLGQRPETVLVG